MRSGPDTLAALLLVCATVAAAPAAETAVERAIVVPRPGKVAVTLDRNVYERARADLGDLRVMDETGSEAPYLLQRVGEAGSPAFRQARTLNRGTMPGGAATLTLDFGQPVLKSELVLSLPGDNFRRRVLVEGRGRGDHAWTTLTNSAYVFAVPDPAAARYETVALPENNHPLLRVTVFRGDDDPKPLHIVDAWVRTETRRRPREVAHRPRVTRTEDPEAHETQLVLDLGARHQPFRAVTLEIADERFFRGVAVEARREPPAGRAAAVPLSWAPISEGTLYRYLEEGLTRQNLRLETSGRHRVLRLRIRNRDDRPLDIRSATVMVPVERLVFEAVAGRRYRLSYGRSDVAPPYYDIERTVGDAALWVATAAEGSLQAPQHVASPGRRPPWTERHPAVLWSGLIAVVAVLGALTWRALRAAA